MNKQQFAIVLLNIAATLTSNQPHERRVILASNQVKNALTMLESSKRILCTGHIERGGETVLRASELELMDAELDALQNHGKAPIFHYTDEMMAEIEAERWGE